MLMMRGLFLDRRWADAHDAQLLLGRRFTRRPADADDAWSLRAGNHSLFHRGRLWLMMCGLFGLEAWIHAGPGFADADDVRPVYRGLLNFNSNP